MSIFDSIISFFKNIFNKKENIKMLEAPTESIQNEAKRDCERNKSFSVRNKQKASGHCRNCEKSFCG